MNATDWTPRCYSALLSSPPPQRTLYTQRKVIVNTVIYLGQSRIVRSSHYNKPPHPPRHTHTVISVTVSSPSALMRQCFEASATVNQPRRISLVLQQPVYSPENCSWSLRQAKMPLFPHSSSALCPGTGCTLPPPPLCSTQSHYGGYSIPWFLCLSLATHIQHDLQVSVFFLPCLQCDEVVMQKP